MCCLLFILDLYFIFKQTIKLKCIYERKTIKKMHEINIKKTEFFLDKIVYY